MSLHTAPQRRTIVLHTHPTWLPQTATWLYNQVAFLPAEVENHIVCEVVKNWEQFPLPNINSLEAQPRWRSFWDRSLRKLGIRRHLGFLVGVAKREQVDVLHSHFGYIGWANLAAARQASMRHVVTFYGCDVNFYPQQDPRWHGRYQEMFGEVALVLCEGPYMARCVVALGCPEAKVRVHHLGIDVGKIPFRPRVWQPGEPLRILIAGTFREKKGIPFALEALGALRHRLPIEVTIIGDATGHERDRLEKQLILETIERQGLGLHVRLLGLQSYDVLLKEAYEHHIFLSPSVTSSDGDTEGGAPVSIIEMAASGMPVVSTTHCDIPEVIRHGETGLLASERDVHGLVEHLVFLTENPQSWRPMLEAGRCHIEAEFDAARQGVRLAHLYQQLAGKPA